MPIASTSRATSRRARRRRRTSCWPATASRRHDLCIAALRRARGWASRGGELALRYARERDGVRRELRRTGADPGWITDWEWS
jgi:hypothetical protein